MKINSSSTVRPAQSTDRCDLAKLRTLLWPDTQIEEHLIELDEIFRKGTNSTLPMAIFVAHEENNALVGFTLRWPYAPTLTVAVPQAPLASWKDGLFENHSGNRVSVES